MNQIYLIISILFLVPASFASLGSTSNPNGSYGGTNRLVSVAGTNAKVCDSSQWEKDFLDVINEEEKSGITPGYQLRRDLLGEGDRLDTVGGDDEEDYI